MRWIALLWRSIAKLRFQVLRLATVKDIPTEQFNSLVEALIQQGWSKSYVYDGIDAWIDYGKIKLKRKGVKLTLEWDNWTEGSLEGPRAVVEKIAKEFGFEAINEWRWSEYDDIGD